MTVDRLAHLALDRVQLHAALDLESILTRLARSGVGRDAHDDAPRAVFRHAVVDDLVAREGRVSLKGLQRQLRRLATRQGSGQLTLDGAAWPSMTFQWCTSRSVTRPSVESVIHVQNVTSSFIR